MPTGFNIYQTIFELKKLRFSTSPNVEQSKTSFSITHYYANKNVYNMYIVCFIVSFGFKIPQFNSPYYVLLLLFI